MGILIDGVLLLNTDDFVPIGGRTSESQAALFRDFLLRANKYQTLNIFGDDAMQKKVILVEVCIPH